MIKQTQTKMFDFSDVGLDFCAGSKSLFPAVFKKLLANGYNPQIVKSVASNNDQVTLDFGVTHNYKTDRVLRVTASNGYNKEVHIDSVTAKTITFTESDDFKPDGSITTKIAPLGWSLVYEQDNVQIYKLLHYRDDSDLYIRFYFQQKATSKNVVGVCIGKTCDLKRGVITDENSLVEQRDAKSVSEYAFCWAFSAQDQGRYNTSNFNDGVNYFGSGIIVGSLYHLMFSYSPNKLNQSRVCGLFTQAGAKEPALDYPVLLGDIATQPDVGSNDLYEPFLTYMNTCYYTAFLGKYEVALRSIDDNEYSVFKPLSERSKQTSSYFPTEIEPMNVTSAKMPDIFLRNYNQYVGTITCVYLAMYTNDPTRPNFTLNALQQETLDIEFNNRIFVCNLGNPNGKQATLCLPVEKIKHAQTT